MTSKKFPLFVFLVLILSFSAACTAHRGEQTHTNLAGIYERETRSYAEVPPTSFQFRRPDWDPGAEFSGNRTSILWGLFTYYDY